ncbi:unknown protein [Waddlia chondrophila 2032/99]|uniref:Uncharacterized protein n=1 Tax=Waddlia chondrophila 2032/99 TaxID=765953 RepID=F8LD14_9BACT|nr:unknown protein [Waddlia chondrophila 2032/99]
MDHMALDMDHSKDRRKDRSIRSLIKRKLSQQELK